MIRFNPSNSEHVQIVKEASWQAYMHCAGISSAVREALLDEGIKPTEEAYSIGLAHVREECAA